MKLVKRIKIEKPEKIYNLKIKNNHNYVAENMVVKNCHQAKSKSITGIMEKCTRVPLRFGFTGTLDDIQVNKLTLVGLFGNIIKTKSTKELIEDKKLSDFTIKSILLKHKTNIKGYSYHDEIDYLCGNDARNNFISNLALSLSGNTLVLYTLVEKHGKPLYEITENKNEKNIHISFVYGGTSADDREEIRIRTEKLTNSIIFASYGTFSTGISIKNLHNIIFASPSKSKIRVFQSIGRGLRLHESKESMTLLDISDDLRINKYVNYTYKHHLERLKYYEKEGFSSKLYNVGLKC